MTDSDVSVVESDSLLLNRPQSIKYLSHLRLRSKSATSIIVWTILIGMAYTLFFVLATNVTINNYHRGEPNRIFAYPISALYAGLAVIALLYPAIGFVSDACCSRFKVVITSFGLIVFSMIIIHICVFSYLIPASKDPKLPISSALVVIVFTAILAILIAFAGYKANFIQLGLNQQISAPSQDLALFVHWVVWAHNLGGTITIMIYKPYECSVISNTAKIFILAFPFVIMMVIYILVLFIGCLKRGWFDTELRQQNPYKLIAKVLLYAHKNKYPRFRSAFTHSDDKIYTRLDFAKERFGGPFTTEQVEDTKTFFKIIAVLLALGPVFVADVPSSYIGFTTFGYHTSNVVIGSRGFINNCSSWILVWSGSLKYILGTVLFPIYMWFIFSHLRNRIPRMFVRLFAGIIMYLLGSLCLLLTDLAGHLIYNKGNSSSEEQTTLCMFHYSVSNYRHLDMHWAVMVLPSVLLGVGPLVVMTTTLEFISAQSPHFMKGLIIGLFFAIIGLFQFIGAVSLIPFSVKEIWATTSMVKDPPITNCGFGYLLFTSIAVFTGLILFVIAARKYTYRVRDDEPYNQSQIEEIVSRNIERQSRRQQVPEI